jgi:hypothetical protein
VAPASAFAAPQLAAPIPAAKSSPATGTTAAVLPLNYASNRRALNAYATYLTTLVSVTPSGDANDTSYIAAVSSQCKSSLAPLTQPSEQVNAAVQHTLTMLGEEMGDDLAINFDHAAAPAFSRFSSTLTHLRWTRLSGWPYAVRHYISSETAVLGLTESGLCADANTAELKPTVVPAATKVFIKSYTDASRQADNALASLTKLMQSYEVPSEKALVARITNLASQVAGQTKADLLASGTALTSVLESN